MKEHGYDWEKWNLKLETTILKGEIKELTKQYNNLEKDCKELNDKLTKYTHMIQALTGRPIDEIVKSWDICDNGFGVNYRFNPNGRSTLDISMSHAKREVLLEKENEELKKRLKSAEQSDYVTPLAERIEDLEKEVKLLWNNAFNGLEKRIDLFDKIREDHEKDLVADIQELFDDMEDRKKDISEQDRRLDCHHNRLMSLTERVDTLSKQKVDLQKQLDKDFSDVYDEFNSIKDTVNDIEFGYIDWSSKMSSAIEDIEETRKHVMSFYDGEFIDTFNKVDERLKKIENLVADTDVDYLEARVRGLEETFKTEPKSKGKKL